MPRTRRFTRKLSSLLAPGGTIVQDIGNTQTSSHSRRLMDLHRDSFASVWPMSYAYPAQELETDETLGGRYQRPPFFFALGSPGYLDVHGVDRQRWERVQFRPAIYHAAMHSVLFTLPFEFEALSDAPPKPSTRELEHVSKTLHDGAVLVHCPSC